MGKPYGREDTLGNFTDEELLQIIKRNLDTLGISYKEEPGGWGSFLPLNPEKVLEEYDTWLLTT